jgi:hypothetical protein
MLIHDVLLIRVPVRRIRVRRVPAPGTDAPALPAGPQQHVAPAGGTETIARRCYRTLRTAVTSCAWKEGCRGGEAEVWDEEARPATLARRLNAVGLSHAPASRSNAARGRVPAPGMDAKSGMMCSLSVYAVSLCPVRMRRRCYRTLRTAVTSCAWKEGCRGGEAEVWDEEARPATLARRLNAVGLSHAPASRSNAARGRVPAPGMDAKSGMMCSLSVYAVSLCPVRMRRRFPPGLSNTLPRPAGPRRLHDAATARCVLP